MYLLIQNEYRHNKKFQKYIDDYCTKNGRTVSEAFKDAHIKQIFWKYTEV